MDDEHICPQNKERHAVCKQASSAYECVCVSACLAFVFIYIHLGCLKSNSMNNEKKKKKTCYHYYPVIHHVKPTIRKSVFEWNCFYVCICETFTCSLREQLLLPVIVRCLWLQSVISNIIIKPGQKLHNVNLFYFSCVYQT